MPTIIQAGVRNVPGPFDDLGNAISQGVIQGSQLGYQRAQQDKANKFGVINSIIAKTFPDELGGFTAAYRSGNPQQAAAADQALGLYLNSVEGITGKRMSPQEREAIKGAFVNGQLTTKQLLASAQAQVMSPQGAQGQPQGQAPQMPQAPQGVPVQGPATPMVSTGTLGAVGGAPPAPRNIEALRPPQPVQQPVPQAPVPQVSPPQAPQPPMNRTTDSARRMAEQAINQGQGYGSQRGGPGSTVNPLQAAEPAAPSSPQGETTINTPADRAVRKKVWEQVLKVNEAKKKGTSSNPFTVGEKLALSPEEYKAVQDGASRDLGNGARAVPTGTGSEIGLDQRELTNVAKAVKSTSTLMDTLLKARNADELGRKSFSVTRALETAAALVPGSKEMDREWAAGTVRALINATPQELAALGLKEEAQLVLQNDANRLAAEQNSMNLFSMLKKNAIDMTQLETSKRIAELQYLGSAAAATGTQQGILTKSLTDITTELIKAAAGANPGKPLTGTAFAKFLNEAGFNEMADFTRGLYGGEGAVYQPSEGGIPIPLTGARIFGSQEKFRAPASTEKTAAGATPGATVGQMASGLLGGQGAGASTSKTSQTAAAKASGIDQFFSGGGVQDLYKQNADKMYSEWQAFLASQQQ